MVHVLETPGKMALATPKQNVRKEMGLNQAPVLLVLAHVVYV